jgi:hypothetical protein
MNFLIERTIFSWAVSITMVSAELVYRCRSSEKGHERQSRWFRAPSVPPFKADINRMTAHDAFVPKAVLCEQVSGPPVDLDPWGFPQYDGIRLRSC